MTHERIGILRLFGKFDHAVGVIGGQDAEFVGAFDGHVDHADRDVGLALFVIGDHRTVVHLVDVIARQNQHVRRMVRADEIEVLVHRVGGAAIPVRADLLLSRDQFDELAQLAAQIAPAALNVLDEGLRLVLGQHGNLPDAGIDAIRQHEIDDAELSAERRRGFAAMLGQPLEPFAAAARHDHRQRTARQSADVASGVVTGSVSHICPKPATLGNARTRFLAAPIVPFARLRFMAR